MDDKNYFDFECLVKDLLENKKPPYSDKISNILKLYHIFNEIDTLKNTLYYWKDEDKIDIIHKLDLFNASIEFIGEQQIEMISLARKINNDWIENE